MKIAVTYENGNIFPHFGHTENFKIYEIEDNKVISSEILDSDGNGHDALAGFLAKRTIDVLICGGIGGGAQKALSAAGIEICSGVEGNADEAVQAYLDGQLVSAGVNCDHHEQEEEQCCGGGCGSCGGGCGGHCGPTMEGPNVGKTLRVHYKGTFNDGSQFDSSYDRNEPLEFVCGMGMMIPGFDKAVVDMVVGEEKDVHLMPEEAYGPYDENQVLTIEVSQMPGAEDLKAGDHVYLSNGMGQPIPVLVTAREGEMITFDANHEMAGKELNFHIEIVEIL